MRLKNGKINNIISLQFSQLTNYMNRNVTLGLYTWFSTNFMVVKKVIYNLIYIKIIMI